jgi:hypothetical protein
MAYNKDFTIATETIESFITLLISARRPTDLVARSHVDCITLDSCQAVNAVP